MQPRNLQPRRLALTATGVMAAAALAVLGVAGSATAASPTTKPVLPVVSGSDYLALGDSITFGYAEPNSVPTPDYSDASNFTGYPEDVSSDLGLVDVNASCPGETSSSAISPTTPAYDSTVSNSNGCEMTQDSSQPYGYRYVYPLHQSYALPESQLAFAKAFLKTNAKTTGLVTVMLGANDGFVCQETTSDQCMTPSELQAVQTQVTANVKKILQTIRSQGYKGQIVLVNYYSLNYTSTLDNLQSDAINQALDKAGKRQQVTIADGFGAFRTASASSGGDPCAAGLLTTLSGGGCGIHPSAAGQTVLAQAVEAAIQQ